MFTHWRGILETQLGRFVGGPCCQKRVTTITAIQAGAERAKILPRRIEVSKLYEGAQNIS